MKMKWQAEIHSSLEKPQVPPNNAQAECAVLGAILLDPSVLADLQEHFDTWMFYQPKHKSIFEAMMTLSAEGNPIDNVTLAERLRMDGVLEKVGGAAYLGELIADVATAANVKHHAYLVREAAHRRRIRELCIETVRRIEDPANTAMELIDEISQAVFQLAQGSTGDGFVELPTVFVETLTAIQRQATTPGGISGIPTGFAELDQLTGGLQPGELFVIAARPSMGKTALALSIAATASASGCSVGIFSLEMSRKQLGMRLLGARASVDIHSLKTGQLTQLEWTKLAEAAQVIGDGMIHINDSAVRTMAQIHAQSRRLKTAKRLDLVIVDYIQLLEGPRGRRDNRQQEVSDISRSLKLLAMDLQIPVIALSQLSRKLEDRPNKRPMLSDLRDSGAIEQDADVVMFIHREDVYDKKSERKGTADILVSKHRNGPIGDRRLKFVDQFARFEDIES